MAVLRRQQGVHAVFPARSNQPRQRQEPADRLAASGGERPADAGVSRPEGEQLPSVDADLHRRHALHPERPRPGGRHRWRERQDGVGTGALCADARRGERVGHPRRGLLARRRRQRRQADLRDSRRVSVCARCRNRQAGARLRRPGAREPALRGESAAGGALQRQHRPPRRRQCRRRHREHGWSGRHRHVQEGSGARGCPGL